MTFKELFIKIDNMDYMDFIVIDRSKLDYEANKLLDKLVANNCLMISMYDIITQHKNESHKRDLIMGIAVLEIANYYKTYS